MSSICIYNIFPLSEENVHTLGFGSSTADGRRQHERQVSQQPPDASVANISQAHQDFVSEGTDSTSSSLVDVIEEAEEDEEATSAGLIPTAAAERAAVLSGGLAAAEVLADNSSTQRPSEPAKNGTDDEAVAMSHQAESNTLPVANDGSEHESNSLSAWLMPELAKVAETLHLLRTRLPTSATPNSWQIEDAICNALEATRRVADQYNANVSGTQMSDDSQYMTMVMPTASPSDNSLIDVMMGDSNPNSEYQTLSRYSHSRRGCDQPDYQKLAMINGLAPPDDSNYEASVVATLSDEDEYDRLAYEFPIHPSMRKRVSHLPPPPSMPDSDDDQAPSFRRGFIVNPPPRPKLVDVAVGRSEGNVRTNEKASNTYRVLNISRSIQAVAVPTAKFSKHVQTHLLVTDKCVGEDDDDLLQRRVDAEVQTDDVIVRDPRPTEDSWGQTEDSFTADISLQANMLRDFGLAVGTQTVPDQSANYVPNPSPLVIETAHKMHMTMQPSPRSVTPRETHLNNQNNAVAAGNLPLHLVRQPARRQFSSASSSGSLRSPSSASTPVSASNGCYQLFVRIDQSGQNGPNGQPQQSSSKKSASNSTQHLHHRHNNRLLSTPSDTPTTGGPGSVSSAATSQMSDIMGINPPSTILSPIDSGTSNTSAFLSSLNSSTLSPPTSDSQVNSGASNDQSDGDRTSSPRSWQSPIQITGPSDPSPVLQRPTLPPRMRRASANPQAAPFRSGQLAAVPQKKSTAYKSLIKISEGSPPEIRHTNAQQAKGSNASGEDQVINRLQAPSAKTKPPFPGQLTQVQDLQQGQAVPATKQITKIIHRLQRDPSIRAWCSVDNLLRQNPLSSSREDLDMTGMDHTPGKHAPERAMSPPVVFREFGEFGDDSGIHEMPIDCGQLNIPARTYRSRYPYQQVVIPPPKTKQLSMSDVSRDEAVLREAPLLKPSKRNNSHHQLNQIQPAQRESVVWFSH